MHAFKDSLPEVKLLEIFEAGMDDAELRYETGKE
jgi:hypothetical protein